MACGAVEHAVSLGVNRIVVGADEAAPQLALSSLRANMLISFVRWSLSYTDENRALDSGQPVCVRMGTGRARLPSPAPA